MSRPDHPMTAIEGIFDVPGQSSAAGRPDLSACPECGAAVGNSHRFCEACGAQLNARDRHLNEQVLPALRRVRRWILVIGLLYGCRAVLGAAFPASNVDPMLLVAPNLALVAIHLGLFLWARRAPFAAAIAALVLFVSHQAADLVLGTSVVAAELVVKLVFALVLWQAIEAGLEVRRQRYGAGGS